jgi:hypothetical protein
MRFFRTASDAVYEQARITLDAAWGHPTPDGRTLTCIEPAATAPRDAQGRIVLAVRDEFCTYSVAVDLLPQLLASGAVTEIDEATYRAAMPQALLP